MDPLTQVLRAARRRVLSQLIATLLGGIASVILACFSLLLIAGVDIVSWAWLWVAGGLSLLTACGLIRRRLPGEYTLARKLDERCGLHDTLATAWHVTEQRLDTPPARFLLASARTIAAQADLKMAFPNPSAKRYLLPAGMGLLAVLLFGARYRTVGHLDLHPSCLTLWMSPVKEIYESRPLLADSKPGHALGREGGAGSPAGQEVDNPQTPEARQGNTEGESRGVLQRLQQALSNLLNQSNTDGATRTQSDPDASSQRDEGGKGEARKSGTPGQAEKPSQSGEHGDQNSAGQGEQGAKNQAHQKDGGMSQSPGERTDGMGNSPQSGAGSDNGSKHIADAAELKAIGRIEELMGKQAAEVSGEMTIVKTSGPQQLSTPFNSREGIHGPTDNTAVNEPIPPQDREFVRKYMDEMHRVTDSQSK